MMTTKVSISTPTSGQSQSTHWWWIRHAPTGLKGRMVGHTDVNAILPDLATLRQISRELPDRADWLISPLVRCQQTTESLLSCGELTTSSQRVVPELKEQNFGNWENRSYDEPDIRDAIAFWDDPANSVPPGGESFAEMTKRVHNVINAQPASENIVVVAHAGVIRAAISKALDLTPEQALRLQIDPLSLTRLTRFQSSEMPAAVWSVQCINQSILSNQD